MAWLSRNHDMVTVQAQSIVADRFQATQLLLEATLRPWDKPSGILDHCLRLVEQCSLAATLSCRQR
jgi:hypothetical protein